MTTKNPSQLSFLLDHKNGIEYWISGYRGSDILQTPDNIEQRPYGTLLMEFLDMDTGLLNEAAAFTKHFAQVKTVRAYAEDEAAFSAFAARLNEIAAALPVVFTDFQLIVQAFTGIIVPSANQCDKQRLSNMREHAQILIDYCRTILQRHNVLYEEIVKGSLLQGKRSAVQAAQVLEKMGEEHASILITCDLKSRCLLLQQDGATAFSICYEPGADLATFISVMLTDIINNKLEIALCRHCGRPFVNTGRAIYCERPADDKGGTCRTVGPVAKYQQSLTANPLIGEHRKAYKKYYARMMKGQISQGQFEEWRNEAKIKLELAKIGKLTDSEFLSWLNA